MKPNIKMVAITKDALIQRQSDGDTVSMREEEDMTLRNRVWHVLERDKIANVLESDLKTGLRNKEAQRRCEQHGYNEFNGDDAGPNLFLVLLSNLFNVMNFVLICATILSILVESYVESIVIASIILANTAIGFFQEARSENTLASLRQLSSPTARVVREGKMSVMPSRLVAIGDVIHIHEGDIVPADLRLMDAVNLRIDEAFLTGESKPVYKTSEILEHIHTCLGDRSNMAFKNSLVTKGRGIGFVVGTGFHTEMGKIAKRIVTKREKGGDGSSQKTPLQRKLNKLMIALFGVAILLGFIVVAACGFNVTSEVLLYAIGCGIAMIPEALPIVLTCSIALSVRRLVGMRAVTRRISSLLNTSAIDYIVCDKTGTLTCGKMVASFAYIGQRNYEITSTCASASDVPEGNLIEEGTLVISKDNIPADGPMDLALLVSSLCSSASLTFEENDKKWKSIGDPTEIALEVFARKLNYAKSTLREQEYEFRAEMPFDNVIKRMTTVFFRHRDNKLMYFAKGALESMLSVSSSYVVDDFSFGSEDYVKPMTDAFMDDIQARANEYGDRGMRVIALGYKMETAPIGSKAFITFDLSQRDHIERNFVFLGIVGIRDPPRPESFDAIRLAHIAGIEVIMATGDYLSTASSISRELRIIAPSSPTDMYTMTASEFELLSDKDIDNRKIFPKVVARCKPDTKVKIIEALQRRKKVVAMTGDGVNDAPALKKASVAFSMGSGSDVSKKCSDIVLTDNNFASIIKAIAEGRRISAAISKLTLHLFSSNIAEVIALICGLAIRDAENEPVFLMSPVQILFLNMLTSSPIAIALGAEKGDVEELMRQPPFKFTYTREFVCDTFFYGIVAGLLTLANFIITLFVETEVLEHPEGDSLNCNKYTGDNRESCHGVFVARAVSFYTLSTILLIHGFVCRHARNSMFVLPRSSIKPDNKALLIAVLFGLTLTIPTSYLPTVNLEVFSQDAITWQWGLIAAAVLSFVVFAELYKLVKNRFFPLKTFYGLGEGLGLHQRLLTFPDTAVDYVA